MTSSWPCSEINKQCDNIFFKFEGEGWVKGRRREAEEHWSNGHLVVTWWGIVTTLSCATLCISRPYRTMMRKAQPQIKGNPMHVVRWCNMKMWICVFIKYKGRGWLSGGC